MALTPVSCLVHDHRRAFLAGHARYFLTDQVDSMHIVTDDTGGAVNRTQYLPYGETG